MSTPLNRRELVAATAALAATAVPTLTLGAAPMYGLIGKMLTTRGNRDAVVAILLESSDGMPGCLSYVVASDPTNADAIWITEVWDSAASHQASLKLAGVQAAIAKARPMIAGFGERFETTPLGGVGLAKA